MNVINCKSPLKIGDTLRVIVRDVDYASRKIYECVIREITDVNHVHCVGLFESAT